MAIFNYLKKEIDAKIVYYGPGVSGKTTNLQFIHQNLRPDQRGKMVSLATNEERTLFFDFLPIELESVRGFKTRFHLYTVPGQVYYGATRRAVLSGADGVIFVADSQGERIEDNLFSLKDLEENLRYYGKKIETTPLIIQYNKRDLPNILPVEELNQKINRLNVPHLEAVAVQGRGVFETLTMACRLVLKVIETGVEARRYSLKPESYSEAAPAMPPQVEKSVSHPDLPRAVESVPVAMGVQLGKNISPALAPQTIPVAPLTKGVRMGKDTPALSPLSTQAGLDVQPIRPMRPEKDALAPVSSKPGMDETRTRAMPAEKATPAPPPAQTARVSWNGGEKSEEEKKKAGGRTLFSWMFDKKKQESPTPPKEPGKTSLTDGGKLRIISCGQPRISSPSSLQIPLTLEVEGLGKSVSFNLSINLEPTDPNAG